MKPGSVSIVLVLSVALLVTCLRPGEDRAEQEREIGHARSGGFEVHVQDGLAAVRALTAENLALWSSAPSLEIEIVALAAGPFHLQIENCMPEAELSVLASGAIAPLESGFGSTKKAWALSLPAGSSRFRLAAPEAAQIGPFRFALMSDVQEAIDRVQDIYRLINAEPDLSFLLGAGDLTQRGTDEQLDRFQRELTDLAVPYYTTLGNHELGRTPPPYHSWFGRGNFQFVHRGVYFTMLDSASASLDPVVYDWLDGWLARGRDAVHVVAMHVPPLDPIGVRNGAFASRAEAASLVGKLAESGVDLTLYGHIHSYYAFDNAGIPAFISGGGGAIPERFDEVGRHFMVFDVDPARGVVSSRRVDVE